MYTQRIEEKNWRFQIDEYSFVNASEALFGTILYIEAKHKNNE